MESLQHLLAQIPKSALVPFIVVMLVVYLLPTIVALVRRRPNIRQILAVNLVAGLSWAAWIATLAWAFLGSAAQQPLAPSATHFSLRRLMWPALIVGIIVAAQLLK